MITDLFITLIILGFFTFGITRPHVALGLVAWINIVKPQGTSYSFLAGLSLSLYATVFFFFIFFLNFRKVTLPKSPMYHVLMIGFMIWITIAHYNAQFQTVSSIKYDVAIKTLIFAYMIPFVLNDKKKVEFFIWVIFISYVHFIFIAGVKSILSGGGYGVSLIGLQGFLYSEGSTLSTIAVCMIPFALFLRVNTKLCELLPSFKWLLLFFIVCSLAVLVGTQARTGLVALVVFVVLYFLQTKHKYKYIAVVSIFATLFVGILMTDDWKLRMGTLQEVTTTEKSAIGRLVVWRWTIDYVADRPFFGGGFNSYLANAGQLSRYQRGQEEEINVSYGKAYHNIFFEVLGETGYGGLLLFLGIILHSFYLSAYKNKKFNRMSSSLYFTNLHKSLRMSLIIFCVGGMFIGVAFYPWMYYLYGIMLSAKLTQKSQTQS